MPGLHHVTAIAGKATQNLKFFTGTLGLRLVKKTINFDDPSTYHLYYGDERGRPGTILTFFPWEHAAPGRGGIGLTHQTSFTVPMSALGYWMHRFIEKGVSHEPLEKKFGESVLSFTDPDGTRLALVGVPAAEKTAGWTNGEVPAENAIRAFHGVTLLLADAPPTAAVLTDVLGFTEVGREESVIRYRAADAENGAVVDIHEAKGFLPGQLGRGSVHHIAFRAADDSVQAAMAQKLVRNHGLRPTQQMDRQYFRSVYFREPGGILFEIATDSPGFAVDEPVGSLGTSLKLPSFLEARRKEIEAVLPKLDAKEMST
jgi:glyoxalase family protein